MKARAFMGAFAMAIAGAGCSQCHTVPSATYDPGMLTGTVSGPAALGFPAAVHNYRSPSNQTTQLPLYFYGGGFEPADGGTGSGFSVSVEILGPDPPFGTLVTLPYPPGTGNPNYMVSATLIDNATWPSNSGDDQLTITNGTLISNATFFSNGILQNLDLAVKMSLIRSDGSLFGVDVDLFIQGHPSTATYCDTGGTD